MSPSGNAKSRRLTWRGKLLLAVLAPIAFLGLFELILRAAGYRYEGNVSPLDARLRLELGEVRVYKKDPALLWTLRPNSNLDYPQMGLPGIRTNSLGLRGPELPGPRRPGEIRVLCLGDSVTFGLSLADEETWPARMEAALGRAPELEGRTVRVINAAVPGWSSFQGLRLLERLGDLDPDLIVFWFGMNDVSPARGVPDSEIRLGAVSSPVLDTLRELRVYQFIAGVVDGIRDRSGVDTRVSPDEFRSAVDHLVELERAGGPSTIFVHTPEVLAVTAGQLERVVARAGEEGVELIVGPQQLLRWVVPAPRGCDLNGRKTDWDGREAILFDANPESPTYSRADAHIERSELELDAKQLRDMKRDLDTILEGLPEGSPDGGALFGDAPDNHVFSDNCHLTEFGARLAGEALARRALEILTRP